MEDVTFKLQNIRGIHIVAEIYIYLFTKVTSGPSLENKQYIFYWNYVV